MTRPLDDKFNEDANCCFPTMVLKEDKNISIPGHLMTIQILRPRPRLLESGALRVEPSIYQVILSDCCRKQWVLKTGESLMEVHLLMGIDGDGEWERQCITHTEIKKLAKGWLLWGQRGRRLDRGSGSIQEMGRDRPAKCGVFKIENKNVWTQKKKVCTGCN